MSNQNKSYQKPLKTILIFGAIMLVIVALCIFGSRFCDVLIANDYTNTRTRIESENEDNKLEFDARMNELRSSASSSAGMNTDSNQEQTLETWSKELNGNLWMVTDETNMGIENASSIILTRADLLNGGLLLVNSWHSLPSDFSETGLIAVGKTSNFTIQVADNNVQLFTPAYYALSEALTAAKTEAGLEHYIVREGYRSVTEQEELFNTRMQKLSSRYSGENLIEETKKDVNYPGTSDYHTGMSFRMDIYEKNNSELNNLKFQAESEQGAWLTENCWRFGIVFRFPCMDFPNENWEDKSYKTGVSTQLNLYRYVGKAHSVSMKVLDFCLEEYLEFLIDHPHICVYEDGALKYEIVRMNCSDSDQEYQLPLSNLASSYQASLDNLGGVVIAFTY